MEKSLGGEIMMADKIIEQPTIFVACRWADKYQPINNYIKKLIKESGMEVSGKMEKTGVIPVPLKETINVMEANGFCAILIPESTKMATTEVLHEISTAKIFQIPSFTFIDKLETGRPEVSAAMKGFKGDLNHVGEWYQFDRKALLEGKEDDQILEYLKKVKTFVSKEYMIIRSRMESAIADQWTRLSDMSPFHEGLMEITDAYDKRPEVLYEIAAKVAANITGAEFGFIGLLKQHEDWMKIVIEGFSGSPQFNTQLDEIRDALDEVKLGYDFDGSTFGFTGYVAKTGESVREVHIQRDSKRLKMEEKHFVNPGENVRIKSELCVPIKIKGRTIGVIDVESPYENSFQRVHQMILEWLSRVIALAYSGNQLESFIGNLSRPLENRRDFADRILTALMKWAQADYGFIAIKEGDRCPVEAMSGRGLKSEIKEKFNRRELDIVPTKGFAGRVFSTGKPIYSDDVERDADYLEWFENVRSEIALPIKDNKGTTIGIVDLEFSSRRKFKHIDKRLLENIANLLALVFDRH